MMANNVKRWDGTWGCTWSWELCLLVWVFFLGSYKVKKHQKETLLIKKASGWREHLPSNNSLIKLTSIVNPFSISVSFRGYLVS